MNLRFSENYRTRITDGTKEGILVGWKDFWMPENLIIISQTFPCDRKEGCNFFLYP
jgi:hypothetical protein